MLDALIIDLCILAALALSAGLVLRLSGPWWPRVSQAALHAAASLALLTHPLSSVGPELSGVPIALLAYRLGPLWGAGAALPLLAVRFDLVHALGLAVLISAASWLRRLGRLPSVGWRRAWWHPAVIFGAASVVRWMAPPPIGWVALLAAPAVGSLAFVLFTWLVRTLEDAHLRAATYRSLAYHDALTGLPNRRAFERDWPAHQAPESFVLLLDLDRFKALNDTYGHDQGDRVLRAFGQVCREAVRRGDEVYRLGGEEFAVLLTHTSLTGARQVGERLRERVRQQVGVQAGVPEVQLTVSGGLVPAISGALTRADALLYAAKEAGRDRVLHEFPTPDSAPVPSLGQDSPAWETVRSVLNFLAHGSGEPNMQGLLEAAVACVPGAEAGSVIVRVGTEAVTRAQVGYGDTIVGRIHSAADMLRWYGGDSHARRAGRPRIATGVQLERWRGTPEQTPEALAIRANLLLPIVVDGQVLAELNLDSLSDPQAFGADSLRVAEEFGLLAAAALASSARRQAERAAHEGALLALGLALEARDHETHGHTGRVVALSGALGAALGLDDGAQDALRQGAYLHDLGKLQVPDTVLLKAGTLTDEERGVIRTHATIGADLAAYLPGLDPRALEVIRHHHERWDGLGYPDGLSGEAIPRLARIFAVCDVYDALLSERPYKRAWTVAEAVRELRAQAGYHFDPHIAQVFVDEVVPAFETEPVM